MSVLAVFDSGSVAGRVVLSLLLSLLLAVGGGGTLHISDDQVIHHPQHFVRALAYRAVGLVATGTQVELQRGARARLDLRGALLEAAPLDFEPVRNRASVGHFECHRARRNPGRGKLDLPLRQADLDCAGRRLRACLAMRCGQAGRGEDRAGQTQRTGEADDAAGAALRNGVHAIPPGWGWDVADHQP